MFISGNTVYALLRDALYLTQVGDKLQFERHHVSQLVAIDIADLRSPTVMKTIDILGHLREGVSRKRIDHTIYVVSPICLSPISWPGYPALRMAIEPSRPGSTPSTSITPMDRQLVQKLKVFEGGGESSSAVPGAAPRAGSSGVAISATSNTLHVVENWHPPPPPPDLRELPCAGGGPGPLRGATSSKQQAVVSIVDISEPRAGKSGSIRASRPMAR